MFGFRFAFSFRFATSLMLLALAAHAVADDAADALRLTRRGVSRGTRFDFDGAFADFAAAIEKKPDFAEAWFQRGFLYMGRGKLSEAIADFNKTLALDPKFSKALRYRGNTHYLLQDYPAAIADHQALVALTPEDPIAYERLGIDYESLGKFTQAREQYDKVLEINPKLASGHINRGDLQMKQGHLDEAIQEYGKALKIKPADPLALHQRALSRSFQGDLEGAFEDVSAAIKGNRADANAYLTRYTLLLRLERDAEAQADAKEYTALLPAQEGQLALIRDRLIPILKQTPSPVEAADYAARGLQLRESSFSLQAIADLRRATELDEFDVDSFFNLGLTLRSLGYFESAIEAYRKALEADDRHVEARAAMAELLRTFGNDPQQAIKEYAAANEIRPDARFYSGSARARFDAGDFEGCVADADKAVALVPKFLDATLMRGLANYRLKNYDAAISDFSDILEAGPSRFDVREFRGHVLREKGDFPGALADYDELEKTVQTGRGLLWRGIALTQMGKDADARQAFADSVKVNPKNQAEIDRELMTLREKKPQL